MFNIRSTDRQAETRPDSNGLRPVADQSLVNESFFFGPRASDQAIPTTARLLNDVVFDTRLHHSLQITRTYNERLPELLLTQENRVPLGTGLPSSESKTYLADDGSFLKMYPLPIGLAGLQVSLLNSGRGLLPSFGVAMMTGLGTYQGSRDIALLSRSTSMLQSAKYGIGIAADAGMVSGGVFVAAKFGPRWLGPSLFAGSMVVRSALDFIRD